MADNSTETQKKGFLRLRSANHNEDTCNNITDDYRNEKFTDFVFICGDDATEVIKAHRLILSKASDYFKKVIETSTKLSFGYPIIPMIALKEVPQNDLRSIVDFIYEGKITIPKKQLSSVVKTAQFLQ
ncbi:fru-related protein-like protein, partial [Leptotrombidium deliense]